MASAGSCGEPGSVLTGALTLTQDGSLLGPAAPATGRAVVPLQRAPAAAAGAARCLKYARSCRKHRQDLAVGLFM